MKIIDGNKLAGDIFLKIKQDINKSKDKKKPGLAVILIGEDPSSELYVKLKQKKAYELGVDFHLYRMDSDVPEDIVLETIDFLNNDDDIDGILVQLPLPNNLNVDRVVSKIDPNKDVDGFTKKNIDKFINGDKNVLWPVFPKALLSLAKFSGEDLNGKTAVIVGNSDIFTKAMVAACAREGLKVFRISCKDFQDRIDTIKNADVIFIACGQVSMLRDEHIKDGAIIIDGGINKIEDKVVGDVDIDISKSEKNGYLSPVPGGVGPVTIACLFGNLKELAYNKHKH